MCGIVACREDRVHKADQRDTIFSVFENREHFFLVLKMHGGNTTGRQQHNRQQQKQHTPQHNGNTHTAQRQRLNYYGKATTGITRFSELSELSELWRSQCFPLNWRSFLIPQMIYGRGSLFVSDFYIYI